MGWNINTPAGTDEVKTVDNTIRTDKQTLLNALTVEHQFTADDTSGYHLQGAAVLIRDLEANLGNYTARAGRLFWSTDKHKLYVGSADTPSTWLYMSPRHLSAGCTAADATSYVQQDDLLDQTAWTALPGLAAVSFGVSGESGSQAGLLIDAMLTCRAETDGQGVLFTLFLDGASVTSAVSGLAVVPYVNNAAGVEPNCTVHLQWLARDVSQGTRLVQVCYRVTTAGATGRLTADFNAHLSVVEV